jgi:tRNA nucleotidyltransferase (CCA-adding enzyme)
MIKRRVKMNDLEKEAREAIRLIKADHPNAQVLAVGGFVRDHILGFSSKDLDLEVFGVALDDIATTLSNGGLKVDLVGKSFGVLKSGELDISVPRSERKTGDGHKGFDVECDPSMTVAQAAERRDFTINAISMDLETGEIIDPVGGAADLKDGILRRVSDAFAEDSLRVLRGMQFAARFNLTMDDETAAFCESIKDDFSELATERVWEEFEKMFKRGVDFSAGFEVLRKTGWIDHFPEIKAMFETEQDPEWHPEGNVGIHTAFVMNEAAAIGRREGIEGDELIQLVASALCHDIGKPDTTFEEFKEGRICVVSPKHDKVGKDISFEFLKRIGAPNHVLETVPILVAEHMSHCGSKGKKPSKRTVRRLAVRLGPNSIDQWARLVEADASGRPPHPKKNPVVLWQEVAVDLDVNDGGPEEIMKGRHLIKELGMKPGIHFGVILKAAFEAQLDGDFEDEIDGLEWIKNFIDENANAS